MIQEAYCSFEVSKLLDEKGFDEPCHLHYHYVKEFDRYFQTEEKIDISFKKFYYPCPTHQMAVAWLRQKYDISIEVSVLKYNCWVYTIYKIFSNKVEELYNDGEFKSYEDAIEAALKYSLENLI